MVSAHSTFISLLIYKTIPTMFSPSSNIHPIQLLYTKTTTTPTIPTILNRNPFTHIINGTMSLNHLVKTGESAVHLNTHTHQGFIAQV